MEGTIEEYDDKKGKWQSFEYKYNFSKNIRGEQVWFDIITYGYNKTEAKAEMVETLKGIADILNTDIAELEKEE